MNSISFVEIGITDARLRLAGGRSGFSNNGPGPLRGFQLLIPILLFAWLGAHQLVKAGEGAKTTVLPGVEGLFKNYGHLIHGKQIGLITNPTGVDRDLRSIVDRFTEDPATRLTALYGPEHGVRGNAQAGEYVPFYFDKQYQVPVFSLYGQTMKPAAGMLNKIDEYMRSFDTVETGKTPEGTMLKAIDVLIFDMQDVGTRVYTFIGTMAYAMQACAENGIPFIVLDRPNPINGVVMEGPVLEYPKYSSFVGLYPIPLRHGMTIGELALLFNDKFLAKKAKLTVIPAQGWRRDQWFDDTGLPWVVPSPNLPTMDSATVYPGQVLFEGTNISEGRGTTRPFEIFGAPWIDGHQLAGQLNALKLPGVKFRETWFNPTFSKFKGELCGGCQLHVVDRRLYRSVSTTLHILNQLKKLYPTQFAFHAAYFDKLTGSSEVRVALEKGQPANTIVNSYQHGVEQFAKLRQPYLLYKPK